MKKEVRFRILNKTSKTVTVKLMGKPMEFSWEEFNKKLIVVDKFWAILNDEEKKKQEEADNLVNDAVVCVMLQRGEASPVRKLSAMMRLGKITQKLQEMLECSNADVLQLIRKRLMLLNPFMVNPMFDKPRKKNNTLDKKDDECEKHNSYEPESTTFGDVCPELSELKKKLENA